MAAPFLAGIYPALARFGYGIARAIRPTKVASAIKNITPVAVKEAQFSPNVQAGVEGAKKKLYSGYRSLYGNTLGKQKGRQVAGGALGTYTTMSFLNRDDDNEEEI